MFFDCEILDKVENCPYYNIGSDVFIKTWTAQGEPIGIPTARSG